MKRAEGDYSDLIHKIKYGITKRLPPVFYPVVLHLCYKKEFNKTLNLKNAKTLSEKLQWLKIHNTNKKKTLLTDKLYAKEYVKNLIPELDVAKVYDSAKSFEELNFDKCPDKFVIKTNHSWRTCTFIKDKEKVTKKDYDNYSKFYKNALKINFAFWNSCELHYKDIIPVVYAEELIFEEKDIEETNEIEVFCFNGEVEFVRISFNFNIAINETETGHFRRFGIWDKNGKPMDFAFGYILNDKQLSLNEELLKSVIKYSKILAKDFDFVRVDFIRAKNKLFFMETTFTPYSGYIKFIPEEYDEYYGSKLNIDCTNRH